MKLTQSTHKVWVPFILAGITAGAGLGFFSTGQAEFLAGAVPALAAMIVQGIAVFFTPNKPPAGGVGSPLAWVAVAIIAAPMLSGCTAFAKVDEVIDKGTTLYCDDPLSRATVKTVLDPSFKAKDKAACIRCPGEEKLSCVGDPGALPDEFVTGS